MHGHDQRIFIAVVNTPVNTYHVLSIRARYFLHLLRDIYLLEYL